MSYNLAELVDVENIKKLLVSINRVVNIPIFIIDNEGKHILETSWCNLCENFHKKNFECKRLCVESNRKIMKLVKGKKYCITTCDNGLIVIGIPIYINKEHIATILFGQFLMEDTNIDFFEKQAQKYGFDVSDYLQALKEIPTYSRSEVENFLEMLVIIKNLISDFAEEQIKVRNANDALEYNNDLLQKIKETYELVLSTTHEATFFDDLTGLPNISNFKEELQNSLNNKNSGAIYYIDIDDFNKVNDLVGHKFGNELLIQVSCKLKEIIYERGIVYRFGGDEFLILEEDAEDKKLVIETAEKISNMFKHSIELNDFKFYITASIGIAFYPEQSSEVNELLKHSYNAVNRAKRKGKNTYEFYQPEMFSEILNRTETEKYLREALEKDQFIINYQPIVDVETGKTVSFEALLRWNSSVLGFVPPDKFIPIAEETGLIVDIGYWVLEHVCNQIKLWNIKGYGFDYISINVSEVQFQKDNFVDLVKNAVLTAGINPKYLALEITESIMIKSMEKNINTLRKLNSIGIKTMMDDFGTGYSSLNYLMKIPINSLKIDKSFIDEICMNPKQEAITEGIIMLAHKINLDVIAEGVENEAQRNLLHKKKCDKIQGYLFSKPVLVEAAEDMLKKFN